MTTRRERFREVLRRLDPIASTTEAINEAWIVRPPTSFVERLGSSLELDLSQNYSLLGGVGSGKTTELLHLKGRLSQDPDRLVVYLDVSTQADLASLRPGALLSLLGLELCAYYPPTPLRQNERKWFEEQTFGRWEANYADEDLDDEFPPEETFVPGLARRPTVQGQLGEAAHRLNHLLDDFKPRSSLLLLLDGLDRLSKLEVFEQLLSYDLRVLKRLSGMQVSTLVVAPFAIYLGAKQLLRGGFDREFLQPYRDPSDETTRRWFRQVLSARQVEQVLPEAIQDQIVSWSGGVLRDLFMLARMAVEEAYVSGSNQVDAEHLQQVVPSFGRKLLLGTGKEQLTVLRRLWEVGSFELITDEHIDLVLHRRILFYENNRYAVHPTLVPLLKGLE